MLAVLFILLQIKQTLALVLHCAFELHRSVILTVGAEDPLRAVKHSLWIRGLSLLESTNIYVILFIFKCVWFLFI